MSRAKSNSELYVLTLEFGTPAEATVLGGNGIVEILAVRKENVPLHEDVFDAAAFNLEAAGEWQIPMTTKPNNDEETKLLMNLEGAIQSARNLGLHDLQLILKMATLELWNQRATRTPAARATKAARRQ